jgi:hypothetical protein
MLIALLFQSLEVLNLIERFYEALPFGRPALCALAHQAFGLDPLGNDQERGKMSGIL